MVKKALRYWQGIKGLMLMYRRSDSLHLEGYSDSDFAGDVNDRKSTSGYVFTLAGEAISGKSSKQTVTASSTMYAEFVSCYEATGKVNWLKKFMPGLKVVDEIHSVASGFKNKTRYTPSVSPGSQISYITYLV